MKQKQVNGLKRASGQSKNKTPFTFTVWYDKSRNRVFTTNDAFEPWIRDYEMLGYIKLLEGSRHFTMQEITKRVNDYWSLVYTWGRGLR